MSKRNSVSNGAVVKQPKRIFSKLFSLILAVAPAVLLCVLPTLVLVATTSGYEIQEHKFYEVIIALFNKFLGKPDKFEGMGTLAFLPLINNGGLFGKIYSVFVYAIPVITVFNLVFTIISLCSSKSTFGMVRTITFFNTVIYGTYAILLFVASKYFGLTLEFMSLPSYVLAGIVCGSFVFYLLYAFGKSKGTSVANLILYLLTLLYVALNAYIYFYGNVTFKEEFNSLSNETDKILKFLPIGITYKSLFYAFIAIFAVQLFFSFARLAWKKGFAFDVLRYAITAIVSVLFIVVVWQTPDVNDIKTKIPFIGLELPTYIYLIIPAAIALIQFIMSLVAVGVTSKQSKKVKKSKKTEKVATLQNGQEPVVEEKQVSETKEEPSVETNEETSIKEEPAPLPAEVEEPAPVEAVEVAEESKYDKFIATLSVDEAEKFKAMFIDRTEGNFDRLPEYVVGGDNKDFFRKVFVYLGKYRSAIPDSILSKMYTFTTK